MNTGNVSENRSLAAQHLTFRVKLKHREMEYCSFLIENCLYLVWCHLDYYMLRSLPHGFPQVVPSYVLTQGEFFLCTESYNNYFILILNSTLKLVVLKFVPLCFLYVGSESVTALLPKIKFFWDVKLCCLVNCYRHFGGS